MAPSRKATPSRRSAGSRAVGSRRSQEYSSVSPFEVEEGPDDHDDDDDDEEEDRVVVRRRRGPRAVLRRSRAAAASTSRNGCCVCCMWLILLLALVGGGGVLLHSYGDEALADLKEALETVVNDFSQKSHTTTNTAKKPAKPHHVPPLPTLSPSYDPNDAFETPSPSAPPSTGSPTEKPIDMGLLLRESIDAALHASPTYAVHYQGQMAENTDWNPFDLTSGDDDHNESFAAFVPPQLPWLNNNHNFNNADDDESATRSYFMQPHIVNNTMVFVSEGDLYLTQISPRTPGNHPTPALKLTTTVGNVRNPCLHPTLPLVAYTATYRGRREVYLQDLRGRRRTAAVRLTYWDSEYGVYGVVGWKPDLRTLMIVAHSNAVSLPDLRLYELTLRHLGMPKTSADDNTTTVPSYPIDKTPTVMQIDPVPLAQALEGVYYQQADTEAGDCLYFTRYKQSSRTVRYVGGTAESLWVYCEGEIKAWSVTGDYNGTSKNPSIWKPAPDDDAYLFFLSDRSLNGDEWQASSMNLWAVPLPKSSDVSNRRAASTDAVPHGTPVQLTRISCEFDGKALQEYTVDAVTGNVILRVGADLYRMTAKQIRKRLQNEPLSKSPFALNIQTMSDFHETQERVIKSSLKHHLRDIDVFETVTGSTLALLGLRGQVWVAPVQQEKEAPASYGGAGQNMPERRYRLVPGTLTGGAVRVLGARNVPLPAEKGTQRWAVVLATDPLSATAEHAFYMVPSNPGVLNQFADLQHLPKPFLGGHVNGGSTRDGGLGSIYDFAVSPCGRRMAWFDTDGRICVMNLPVYSKTVSDYIVLPDVNELGEPLIGLEVDLVWSPGGRYLAVNHYASNQFRIISIVDCGVPEVPTISPDSENIVIAPIQIGRIVQATPSRFNSYSPVWGKSPVDDEIHKYRTSFAKLADEPKPTAYAATTIFFLADRDLISDVGSPFGSRAPLPHFPDRSAVYALPLSPVVSQKNDIQRGQQIPIWRYSGGGVMEIFAEEKAALDASLDKAEELKEDAEEAARNRRLSLPTVRELAEDNISPVQRNAKRRKKQSLFRVSSANPTESPSGHHSDGDANTGLLSIANKVTSPSPSTATPVSTLAPQAAISTDAPTTLAPVARVSTGEPSTVAPVARGGGYSADTITSPPSTPPSSTEEEDQEENPFSVDMEIDFGSDSLTFSRRGYRLANIPKGKYVELVAQTDDLALIIIVRDEEDDDELRVFIFSPGAYPSDAYEKSDLELEVRGWGVSTSREHVYFVSDPHATLFVVPNTESGISSISAKSDAGVADASQIGLNVWPHLEYKQMYDDAWRMLRDYFYDANMHHVDWPAVHQRYSSLVQRCNKREELDDVLNQMAAELSALHVFVYGGEYSTPLKGDDDQIDLEEPGSLGASMARNAEWKGYLITEIAHRDPDFNLREGKSVYSPLSEQSLSITGQKGLVVGDVIVGVNGESVFRVPDIQMLLRGTAGCSVRLEVLRLVSGQWDNIDEAKPEPVIVVPLSQEKAAELRYDAWEWKTRERAKELADEAGFSVGYIHLRSMVRPDMDSFARFYFEDYNKEAMILDVRHNGGGNIDSWVSSMFQRKSWSYFQGRTGHTKGLAEDWNQHFAFRGHLVVLIDEHTGSDGEGIARSLSELGIARLIGTRTWGGGIWLSSDNRLVDGGIATAPELGTYNEKFDWGMGIEQQGIDPDVVVDNNPRTTFDGKDLQLRRAINELRSWLDEDPISPPKPPEKTPDMSAPDAHCEAW